MSQTSRSGWINETAWDSTGLLRLVGTTQPRSGAKWELLCGLIRGLRLWREELRGQLTKRRQDLLLGAAHRFEQPGVVVQHRL